VQKNRTKQVTDKKGNKKDALILQEGAIYFRYAGRTKTIGYSDLQHMLADRGAAYPRSSHWLCRDVQESSGKHPLSASISEFGPKADQELERINLPPFNVCALLLASPIRSSM
jgi:hypothetical protein